MAAKFTFTAALIAAAALTCSAAQAQSFARHQVAYGQPQYAATVADEPNEDAQIDPRLQRQMVSYSTNEAPGTIVIDTPNTFLYFILGNGQAIRYGIGVGREGFTWAGVKQIAKKAEWPDWYPPQSMISRQPYLPRFTAGGPGNPLGARAMYLGSSEYRIHGTNNPSTIGKQVSSGCIRLTNEDVTDLYNRVAVGAKVVVLPMTQPANVAQLHAATSSYAQATPSNAQRTWATIR